MCHWQFFRKIAQNLDYIRNFCNYSNNALHFACRKWYLDNQLP